jgi:hypothetical protein
MLQASKINGLEPKKKSKLLALILKFEKIEVIFPCIISPFIYFLEFDESKISVGLQP